MPTKITALSQAQRVSGVEDIVERCIDKGVQCVVVVNQTGTQEVEDNSKSLNFDKPPGFLFNVGDAQGVYDEKTIKKAWELWDLLPTPKLQSFYRLIMEGLDDHTTGMSLNQIRKLTGVSTGTIKMYSSVRERVASRKQVDEECWGLLGE